MLPLPLFSICRMKPKGNGLVELIDDKTKDNGFFCMRLVAFLNEEAKPGTEEYRVLWEQRFTEAKQGGCAYKTKCGIYKRTMRSKKSVQLELF